MDLNACYPTVRLFTSILKIAKILCSSMGIGDCWYLIDLPFHVREWLS